MVPAPMPAACPACPWRWWPRRTEGSHVSPKPAPPTPHCPRPEAAARSSCERLGGTRAQGAGRTLTGHWSPAATHVTLDTLAGAQAAAGSAFGNCGAGGLLAALLTTTPTPQEAARDTPSPEQPSAHPRGVCTTEAKAWASPPRPRKQLSALNPESLRNRKSAKSR